MDNCCFFIGPADAPESIYPTLVGSIDLLVTDYGVAKLLVGHWNKFDGMAIRAGIQAKSRYPHVRLILLTARDPAADQLTLRPEFDDVLSPRELEPVPPRAAASSAAMWAVQNVSHIIAYARHGDHEDLWHTLAVARGMRRNITLI